MTPQLTSALISVLEGCRLVAYQDSGGVWTIAHGHTKGVKQGDTCTVEQAEVWLSEDAEPLFNVASASGNGKVSVFGVAALVSFGYNCGLIAMEQVIEGKSDIRHYVHDRHGRELPGLVTRRNLEYQILAADGFFVAG